MSRRASRGRASIAGAALAGTALLLFAAPVRAAETPGRIHVGPNVHVSAARPRSPHNEVLFAADPTDPKRLLGCSMVYSPEKGGFSIVAYSSFDGGARWESTLETDLGNLTGDPACGFGPNGRAYTVALGGDENVGGEDDSYTYVYRSSDGGRTWEKPVKLSHTDREYLAVDTTGGKNNGRIYLNATTIIRALDDETQYGEHMGTSIGVFQSDDGGATFTGPIKLASTANAWVLGMGNGVVLSDGTFAALFGEQLDRKALSERRPLKANASLKLLVSHDSGQRFRKAAVVSDWFMGYGGISDNGSVVPVLAVDSSRGPFQDRLYAVWPDYRSGRSEILFSSSADNGKTWTPPVFVNDDAPWPSPARGPDDILPVVSVNSAGVVGVAWYDRRDHPDNLAWTVRFTASFDGGDSFLPSVPVSPGFGDPLKKSKIPLEAFVTGGAKKSEWVKGATVRANLGPGGFLYNGGHTAGMAADAGGAFHPFWVDHRTGVPQLWTAAVRVDGAAIASGAPELADLEDVSGKLTLSITNAEFDLARGTISAEAAVENNSKETVRGPVRVRVLSFRSGIGTPELTAGASRSPSGGVVLDYTDLLPGGALAPEQRSRSRKLEIRIREIGALRPREDVPGGSLSWLDVNARIYGKPDTTGPDKSKSDKDKPDKTKDGAKAE